MILEVGNEYRFCHVTTLRIGISISTCVGGADLKSPINMLFKLHKCMGVLLIVVFQIC